MKREVGLWVDHRKAVMVIITDEGEEVRRIKSNMEKHARFANGSSEDVRDRQFANHLSRYFGEWISCFRDADSILIFGPGEAKVELQKRLQGEDLSGRIVGIETTDKMTTGQIAAKIRQHFRG